MSRRARRRASKPSRLRIVAGTHRGRYFFTPPGEGTRPTTNMVREATFNALGAMGAVVDATVCDLFSGSGAMGIEALSRGARKVTFVESDPAAVKIIKENIETLGFSGRAEVIAGDVMRYIDRSIPFDLVFCDPPYTFDQWEELISKLGETIVVTESDRSLEDIKGGKFLRHKRYGSTFVSIISTVPSTHLE